MQTFLYSAVYSFTIAATVYDDMHVYTCEKLMVFWYMADADTGEVI